MKLSTSSVPTPTSSMYMETPRRPAVAHQPQGFAQSKQQHGAAGASASPSPTSPQCVQALQEPGNPWAPFGWAEADAGGLQSAGGAFGSEAGLRCSASLRPGCWSKFLFAFRALMLGGLAAERSSCCPILCSRVAFPTAGQLMVGS